MQQLIDYNFLVIGRSGAGKSATSKFLTGDPSITVANSLHEVTKQVKFYRGVSHSIKGQQIRFGILDLPGLDKITNRFSLRELILQQLQKLNISLHGIIYIASLTERDPLDSNKLFQFIGSLPWSQQLKHNALIPILTKYDNFLMDSPDEDITRTKQQFAKLFMDSGYSSSWHKRTYWINFTRSLQYKIALHPDIRIKYQNQIQRLLDVATRNKKQLTKQQIKQYIAKQQSYVLDNILSRLQSNSIPYKLQQRTYRVPLHIKLQPSKINQSLTAFSASSIGIFIAKIFKRDIPFPVSLIMMGIPMTLTFVNFITAGQMHTAEKLACEEQVGVKVMNGFARICLLVNEALENQWREISRDIQFEIADGMLVCQVHLHRQYRFFAMECLDIWEENRGVQFGRVGGGVVGGQLAVFGVELPEVGVDGTWEPIVAFNYHIKEFEEDYIFKLVETLRNDFNAI